MVVVPAAVPTFIFSSDKILAYNPPNIIPISAPLNSNSPEWDMVQLYGGAASSDGPSVEMTATDPMRVEYCRVATQTGSSRRVSKGERKCIHRDFFFVGKGRVGWRSVEGLFVEVDGLGKLGEYGEYGDSGKGFATESKGRAGVCCWGGKKRRERR